PAFGLSPWLICTARTPGSARESACSSATESTPPESPTRMRLPASSGAARATAAGTSALLGFPELAIAHEPVEPRLHQLFPLLLLDLLERFGERALERLRRGLRIAMRTAERLGHDLVDEPERLQPARGDAERLGRIRRHVGAAPEDRRAAFRGNDRVGRILHHLHHVA